MMQSIFKSFLLLFSIGYLSVGYSQLDNPNGNNIKGRTIGVIEAPTSVKEVKKPKSLEFGNDNGFKTANTELEKKRIAKRKEKEIENKGIITPEMMAKRAFKKNVEGNRINFPMIDMDLGSFYTKSEYMIVAHYDFGVFDGDKVSISVNGKRIHNNLLLTPQVKGIKIPLELGINKIEITALNEGRLSPNTGGFSIYDNKNQTVKEGEWILAEGAKVIAIVVRDEK